MKIDLAGKVALVTASTAGIGFAIAKGLAESGAEIIINGRSEQSVNAAIARLQNEVPGAKARPAVADLSGADGAAQLLQAVTGVDILVNNAGGGSCIPLEELPEEEWRKVLSLDLDGSFYCMKHFGKVMLEKGYGRVINIASILGKGGLKELPVIAYASAKGGVINMTRQAAIEWATRGVTVNALCPGFFASESNGPEAMESMNDFICNRSAMCRPGKEGELDSSIVFLAARESSYVTAAILTCDGGWTAV